MPTIRITIGEHGLTPTRTRSKPLANRLKSLPDEVHETRRVPLGRVSRARIRHRAAPARRAGGVPGRRRHAARHALPRSHGPRAVLNALDRLAGTLRGPGRHRPARTWRSPKASSATTRPASAQPFAHDAYLAELTGLRDQLKAGLSGADARSRGSRAAARRRDSPSGSRR